MSAGAGAALDRIGEVLGELGYPSQRLDEHPELPIPTLLVAARDGSEDQEPTVFSLMFMPIEGTGLDHIDLLQIHFPILEGLEPARRGEMALLVAEVDGQLPLGQLGILDDEVVLRHTMLLEREHLPTSDLLEEALGFLLPLRALLASVVSGVASGEMSFDTALSALP